MKEEQIKNLSYCIQEFIRCIDTLPALLFLTKIDNWSPRDVLAHLIGWNRYTIEGCQQIRRGEIPFYFIDPGDDFSKVNALLVKKYNSSDKRRLINELETSAQELEQFLLSVDPTEWEANYGVTYEGEPVTIKNSIDVLIRDYVVHRQRIEKWAESADIQTISRVE